MSSTPPVPRLKKMVELMLDENPKYRGVEVRNSDIALTIVIWQRWYNVGTNEDSVVHLHRLFDLPREDNVKRVRAVFQNVEHKYLPTNPDILIKRGIEQEYWEEALGYRLTREEWTTHHQTLKEANHPLDVLKHTRAAESFKSNKPRTVGVETPPSFKTADEARAHNEATGRRGEPVRPVTKMQAVCLRKSYSKEGYQHGQTYELGVERIAVGNPIRIVAPFPAEYRDLKAFGKDWRVLG